ncbi:MAG: inositol monophosphatase [Gammaproteobacteria bacterium]|nr:inositol monophosphatase [Gammaproteobacteria bacterium]
MQEYLQLAEHAARQAGAHINQSAARVGELTVEQKGLHDYVSEVDREAERRIAQLVAEHFSDHVILGEEFGAGKALGQDITWVVDPLDGTTNFLRGIAHYAVSIAVLQDKQPICGVVYDPCKDEMFSALKGQGASLNGQPISVSNSTGIEGALLATGVPYGGPTLQTLDPFVETVRSLMAQRTSGIRRLGAAALDLAYVAAGRYEGFWEANLSIWDIAAGALIVQEAGGQVTDLAGENGYLSSGNILAATPAVHKDILQTTVTLY